MLFFLPNLAANSTKIGDISLHAITKGCPNLITLTLGAAENITDDTFKGLGGLLLLYSITMNGSKGITDSGLAELTKSKKFQW